MTRGQTENDKYRTPKRGGCYLESHLRRPFGRRN